MSPQTYSFSSHKTVFGKIKTKLQILAKRVIFYWQRAESRSRKAGSDGRRCSSQSRKSLSTRKLYSVTELAQQQSSRNASTIAPPPTPPILRRDEAKYRERLEREERSRKAQRPATPNPKFKRPHCKTKPLDVLPTIDAGNTPRTSLTVSALGSLRRNFSLRNRDEPESSAAQRHTADSEAQSFVLEARRQVLGSSSRALEELKAQYKKVLQKEKELRETYAEQLHHAKERITTLETALKGIHMGIRASMENTDKPIELQARLRVGIEEMESSKQPLRLH